MTLRKVNSENNIGFCVSWIIIRWKVKGHRQWKIWPVEDFSYCLFAAWQLFHTHACSEVVFYNICDIGVCMSDIWPASVDYTVQDMSVTWQICWNGEQFSLRNSFTQLLKKLTAPCGSWRSAAVITKAHRWTRNLKSIASISVWLKC